MLRVCCLLLFVSLLLPTAGKAQQPVAYNLGIEEGLPSNTVYDLLIHPQTGELYAATELGFCRYNGAGVQLLHMPPNMGLSGTGLMTDSRGQVWCRSFSGQLFMVVGDSLRLCPVWQALNADPVGMFDFDTQGRMYVATIHHIYRSNPQQTKFEKLDLPHTLSHNAYIFQLATEGHNGFYISTNIGLSYYEETASGQWQETTLSKPVHAYKLCRTPAGVMAMEYTPQTGLVLRLQRGTFDTLIIHRKLNVNANELSYDGQGVVWTCTQSGAIAMPLPPAAPPATSYILPNQAISCVRRNNEGSTFVGSLRNGLWGMAQLGVVQVANATEAGDIVSLKPLTDGRVAVGYFTGLVRVGNWGHGLWSEQRTPDGRPVETIHVMPDGSAIWAYGHSFPFASGTGHLLPGTWLGVAKSMKDAITIGSGTLLALQNHALWLHTQPDQPPDVALAYKWNSTKSNDLFLEDGIIPYSACVVRNNQQRIRALCNDGTAMGFYLAAADGLWWYQPNQEPQAVLDSKGNGIFARTLTLGPEGLVYAGTFDKGLCAIHKGKTLYHIGTADGLPSDAITQMLPLADKLWVGTSRGLCRLHTQPKPQTTAPPARPLLDGVFTRLDGLPADEIVALAPSGTDSLFIATHLGVVRMARQASGYNHTPPTLRLLRLSINDEPQAQQASYRLGPDKQDISIHLQALALRSRGHYAFRYRLLGYDDNYQTISAQAGPILLRALPAGFYTFEAYAVNEDGVQSLVPLRFDLQIDPPYYQRLWFYVLVGVVVLLLAYVVFRLRVRSLNRKNKLSRDLLRARMVALRTQMNPHFLFNALNAMQEAILLRRHDDAQHQLGVFAELLRLTLECSEQQTIRIETELRMLELYLELEHLRFSDTLVYSLTFAPDTPRTGFTLPAMIVQPFAENALKHGLLHKTDGPRQLDIHFSRLPDQRLSCTITDNGIGRAAARALAARRPVYHRPFAEQATRHRIDLLNQSLNLPPAQAIELHITDLQTADGQPAGTCVQLIMPTWADGTETR